MHRVPESRRPWRLGWLVALLAITFAAAAVGGLAAARASELYLALARPSWAPPSAVFGPVWTVLYVLIAVAAWIVVRDLGWHGARTALVLYGAQLVANALWTWLFFAWHSGPAAFADIVVLLVLIVAMIRAFWRVRPLAGSLLLPYLAWVAFACALTWAVWMLNPGVL